MLSDRAKLSFDMLGAISGGDFDDNNGKHLLVVKLMQQNFSFFQDAADAAGLFKRGKVSVKDAISIKALARLSMNKIRDLCTCLSKLGCNFWPSEKKMRAAEKIETEHVTGDSSVEKSGLTPFKRTATCEQTEMLPYIRVNNLSKFLNKIVDNSLNMIQKYLIMRSGFFLQVTRVAAP